MGNSHDKLTEIAWAAGFYDGEGNTCSTNNGRGCTMSVSQCDLVPLCRFQRALAGAGKIYGPYPGNDNGRCRPFYVWKVSRHDDVMKSISLLWPHLSKPKRKQFEKHVPASASINSDGLNFPDQLELSLDTNLWTING